MRLTLPPAARVPLAVAALWLAYWLIETLQDSATPGAILPMSWLLVVADALLFWVPLTLVFLAFAQRVPLTGGFWPWGALKFALAASAAVLYRGLWYWLVQPFHDAIYGQEFSLPPLATHLAHSFYVHPTRVLLVIAFCYAWVHLRRMHEHRMHIAELETRVTRARLDALSAQLNPHFLFNTLNSIAELIHIDPDAADRMLMTLSALLRFNLSATSHEITVENEVALVEQYFSIEKVRLGERLDVHWSVQPDTRSALVPVLILQPLAENAIVHGIARRRTPGAVRVAIRSEEDRLVMEIANDGHAAAPRNGTVPRRTGVGVANTRARLDCLYGARASLDLQLADDGGCVARITLPLRHAGADDVAAADSPAAAAP